MLDISVIICSHNPQPNSLLQVLRSLRDQTLPMSKWELLVVDNGSIKPLKASYDISWHPQARHTEEAEIGLSVARCRGILEARGNILVFVDDDNILDPNYLSNVLAVSLKWPSLGAWGSGHIAPIFESKPPEHLLPFLEYLAIRNMRVANWTNVLPCNDATPWGAGLAVRSDVAAEYREMCNNSKIQISGRKGSTLLSGEDMEISYVACGMDYGVGTFPELKLSHLIPKRRIEENYLLRIVEASKVSDMLLSHKWRKSGTEKNHSPSAKGSLLNHSIVNLRLQLKLIFLRRRAYKIARRMIADFEDKP